MTDSFGNVRVGFAGSATVNRKDYGIPWNASLETGGVIVGEKIVLQFDASSSTPPPSGTPESTPPSHTAQAPWKDLT